MGDFTEHRRLLAIAQAANVPVTLRHEELAILLDALTEQETEVADLERQLKEARMVIDAYVEAWKQYVLFKRMAAECDTCFESLAGARKDLSIARARLIDLAIRPPERD